MGGGGLEKCQKSVTLHLNDPLVCDIMTSESKNSLIHVTSFMNDPLINKLIKSYLDKCMGQN